jgi:hypothetical protein
VEPWLDLLVAPGTRADLEAVFGDRSVFAEAALEPLGRALGLPADRLQTGYRYLSEDELPADTVALRYAHTAPAAAVPAGPPLLRTGLEDAASGFMVALPGPPLQVAEGAEVRGALTTRNAGGGGRGLRVEVVPAGGVVSWQLAQLVVGDPRKLQVRRAGGAAGAALLEAPLVEGMALFPDAALPPGGATAPTLPITSTAALHRMMDAQYASQVHVNLVGQAVARGEGRWQIRLVPLTPGAGAATGEVQVVVKGTEGRPLRAPAEVSPLLLAPLEGRQQLVLLLVSSDDEVGRAVDRLNRVLMAVAGFFPADGKISGATFVPAPTPRQSSVKAAGYLSGKRWAGVVESLRQEATLAQVSFGAADGGPAVPRAQLSLGRGIIPGPTSRVALVIGFRADSVDVDAAATALRTAVDAVFAGGEGAQALLTRWRDVPMVDSTPYELACGVHGQCTLEAGWVDRWLRAVAEGMLWMGPTLVARVDRPALAAAAQVRELGTSLAVEVQDVAAVERGLADLLPDAPAWMAGMKLRYSYVQGGS